MDWNWENICLFSRSINNDGFLLPDLKHNRASGNIEVNTISELDLLAEETRRYPTTSMTGVKKEIINLPSVPGNKNNYILYKY